MKLLDFAVLVTSFLYAGSVALPDTTVGSPRSIVLAVAGLLTAVIAYRAHNIAQGTAPAPQ